MIPDQAGVRGEVEDRDEESDERLFPKSHHLNVAE